MSIRAFVVFVACLLFAAGVGFLAVPVYVGYNPSVACGNAFHPAYWDTAHGEEDAIEKAFERVPVDLAGPSPVLALVCGGAISQRRWIGWPLGAVGLVVFLGAMLVRVPARRTA